MGDQQRSEAEWKFGMGKPSQNAFVSGWPKKAFAFCIERMASRNRWVVPTQADNREKWFFFAMGEEKTNRVAPREYLHKRSRPFFNVAGRDEGFLLPGSFRLNRIEGVPLYHDKIVAKRIPAARTG